MKPVIMWLDCRTQLAIGFLRTELPRKFVGIRVQIIPPFEVRFYK